MAIKKPQQCPYNEACWCTTKNCERCGWYPKKGEEKENKEEKE